MILGPNWWILGPNLLDFGWILDPSCLIFDAVRWLVGWLAGCLLGCLASWLVEWLLAPVSQERLDPLTKEPKNISSATNAKAHVPSTSRNGKGGGATPRGREVNRAMSAPRCGLRWQLVLQRRRLLERESVARSVLRS